MRTASKSLSHAWVGAGLSAGASRVIAHNVGDTVQIYGPGADPIGWCGGVNPLPADMELGTHTLTLNHVVIGSRVFIQDQARTTTHYDQIATASTVVIPLNIYGVSSLNDWLIKIRQATNAPYYQPYETQMTATVGSSSIYVSQLPD